MVYGNGSQTRDFVYIDDVVDALISAALAPGVDQQIINVGSGIETSVNALVAAIGAITELKTNVLYNHETTGGLARLVADLTKAKHLLGYQPRTQLETGLRKLLEMDPILAKSKRSMSKTLPAEGQTAG